MQLLRLGAPGREVPAVRSDSGEIHDLRPLTAAAGGSGDIDGEFLGTDGVARTRDALAAGTLPMLPDADSLRVGAPIGRPGAVLCIGLNYAAHAAEGGHQPPKVPILFFKHPNTVIGPNDDVLIPRGAKKVDWEVELGVVIGRRARYLDSPADALAHVAGLTVANDVSERDFQGAHSGGQWSKGKSAETFNPVGPWLVPLEDPTEVPKLRIRSWVNGQARQDSDTGDMIFGVAELIWHLSQYLVLEPGDLLNTGTPEGVAASGRFAFLAPGDVMEMEIDGLGRQRSVLRAA